MKAKGKTDLNCLKVGKWVNDGRSILPSDGRHGKLQKETQAVANTRPGGRQLGCTCSVCTFRYTSTPPFTHTHAHADIDCRVGTLWLHCMSKPSAGRTLIVSSCVCVCVFCWSFRHGCWLNCIQRLIVWFGGRLSIVYCNVHCVIKGNHQEVEWWCPRLVQHPWGDHQTLSDCIPIRLVVETNTFCGVSRYCRRGKRIRYTSSPENTYITYLVERGDNQKPRSIFLWPTDNEWLPWVYSQPCVDTLLHVKENRRVKPLTYCSCWCQPEG